jgi:hypothetical protein
MKSINLLTHLRSRKNIDEKDFILYAKLECQSVSKVTKSWEEDDLESFCQEFGEEDYVFFDHFFYNFKIEQISKEFDLLRIGTKEIINIELKHDATKDRILKQLLQNRYYLAFLDTPIYSFTYIAKTHELYMLKDQNIEKCDVSVLKNLLINQEIRRVDDLNTLFQPELFLVSPFAKPQRFLAHAYFLTDQQRMIEGEILKNIEEDNYNYYAISGEYGTGKTLLCYDMAKEMMSHYQTAILHCAKANSGIKTLNENGYKIYDLSRFDEIEYKNLKILLIDESQRLTPKQRSSLLVKLSTHHTVGIFVYDPHGYYDDLKQYLSFLDDSGELRSFHLTHRIRTNKVMAGFINALLYSHHVPKHQDYSAISLVSVSSVKEAQEYLSYLATKGYYSFDLEKSSESYYEEQDPFYEEGIAGCEFDKVALTLDERFYYDEEGRLKAKPMVNLFMLYQAVTRVRKKLCVIVINNGPVFTKGLRILGETYE